MNNKRIPGFTANAVLNRPSTQRLAARQVARNTAKGDGCHEAVELAAKVCGGCSFENGMSVNHLFDDAPTTFSRMRSCIVDVPYLDPLTHALKFFPVHIVESCGPEETRFPY